MYNSDTMFLTECNKNIDPRTTIVNQIVKDKYEQSKSNDQREVRKTSI